MATLSNLPVRFFALMSPDQRFDLVRELRTLRRVPTTSGRYKPPAAAKKKTAAKSVDRQVENLSSEQLVRLLELLENAS